MRLEVETDLQQLRAAVAMAQTRARARGIVRYFLVAAAGQSTLVAGKRI